MIGRQIKCANGIPTLTLLLVFAVIQCAAGGGIVYAQETSGNAGVQDQRRDVYFPNTEELAPDEMRVVALGTGTPHIRPSQKSTSWLVELGNGDKFFFDIGTGSIGNFSALEISYDEATTVFFSHLHTDHIGDFDALWASGWTAGRLRPLRVWGPSGTKPELGTKHFVDKQLEALAWDYSTRSGKLPEIGSQVEIHEFDYRKTHVVYEENGVKVTSFPAMHILDGAVSYRLDWNGLSFVFSGDTTPNRWFVENSKNADLVVHEVYMTVDQLKARFGWDNKMANLISTVVHTSPTAAGKIFSMVNPRMAVGFHFYNDYDTAPEIEKAIRKTYRGPLMLAQDLMVFNVTPEEVRTRMAVTNKRVWPLVPDRKKFAAAKRAVPKPMTDWLKAGRLDLKSDK